jgi:hypothetical protein
MPTLPPDASHPGLQIVWLIVLALPIATVAWTITHEELFRELREYCVDGSKTCRTLLARKFFYIFTCEYCFSHWVTLTAMALTGYRLLLDDWRGVGIAFFALVGVANMYMSLFGRLRVDIKHERVEIAVKEEQLAELNGEDSPPKPPAAVSG